MMQSKLKYLSAQLFTSGFKTNGQCLYLDEFASLKADICFGC
jgi:hypothetical protein